MFEQEAKKNKLVSRLVALLGISPGVWFLVVTQTEFGQRITLNCGYWFFMLLIMSFVWLFYAVFIKKILRDAKVTQQHAHDLNEQHMARIVYTSTIFEALVSTVIFVLSVAGFLLTDIVCFMSKFAPTLTA